MRLRSRLERLERRLHAGADKLAMCQFFELLGRAIDGEELSPEEDRQLEELEQQLPLAQRQLLEQIVRKLDEPVKTVEEMILEGWPTDSTAGAELGRNSWVKSRDQSGIVNFHRRLQRLE